MMQIIDENTRDSDKSRIYLDLDADYEDEEEAEETKHDDDDFVEIKTYKDIEKELGIIHLSWPIDEINNKIDDNSCELMINYRETSEKEKLLLWYAENFRKQYHRIYNDRKPLILACNNEFDVQKFVSTNIRPSTLPYPQLHDWLGCAKFVSDHLAYEPLKRHLAIPEQIRSPTWLLNNQRGNSFEFSIFLVSLLIGQGYNAFVVSGYASREQTLCDMSMQPCPYLPKYDETSTKFVTQTTSRYQLKAPPDFRSKLLMEIEELERMRKQEEYYKNEEERERIIIEQEKPKPDKYWGHRVHGWVLVLPNDTSETTRYHEIKEPFFIEPTTGYSYGIKKQQTEQLYHGIESIWNNRNYWVNMQFCMDSCTSINWDLDNSKFWEHLLPGEYASSRDIPNDDGKDDDTDILADKHLDMPFSYVDEIKISNFDFERHYPNGRKIMYFKKTKVVLIAPYVQMDGLISRITEFDDYNYSVPLKIHEKYENRGDKLRESIKDLVSGTVMDFYDRGRPDACKEHRYSSLSSNLLENERILKFYDVVRIDGLEVIETTNSGLIQYYIGRKDLLYYRNVEFSMENEFSVPQKNQYRKIAKITEMFARNCELPANEDIAIREFLIDENEIHLKFHYGDDDVTRATRMFVKPAIAERGDRLVFHEEMTDGYDPDPMAVSKTSLQLLELLEAQLKAEEKSINFVRDAEKEISGFLKTRKKEYFMPKLVVSLFDRNRNEEAKAGMFVKEELLHAQSQREMKEDVDYLRPFLSRIGNPKTLTKSQALEIRQECVNDFKQILANRANEIWRKLAAHRKKLEESQSQLVQDKELRKEDKEELVDEINRVNMEIHTLEIRLKRHCDLASERYQEMLNFLDEDERLSSLRN